MVRAERKTKTKSQGSQATGHKILQSKIDQSPKNGLAFNRLAVVHGRLISFTKGLKEESERHIREALTKDLFDLLKEDKMTTVEMQRAQVARDDTD